MGKITISKVDIEGVFVIEPKVFYDERGYFTETYNQQDMYSAGLNMQFVQDNQSRSIKGVIRGLHFQKEYPQGKLVRVIHGRIFDVVVDLRYNSVTFGKWFGIELSANNKKQLYIPEGFAHGFLTMEDDTEVCYKVTDFYHPGDESGLKWDDSILDIDWPLQEIESIIINQKDNNYMPFSELLIKKT